jgi:hypothetical protein
MAGRRTLMQHYDVVIATPGERIDAHYVRSLVKTTKQLDLMGISWTWINNYCSHVSVAREYTFNLIPDITYNKIFWIDSDISWHPVDFMSLYNSEKDIISGVYITISNTIAAHGLDNKRITKRQIAESRSTFEIMGCGYGFVCVKYGINESMSRPLFRDIEIDGEYIHGEDVSWCLRARSHGYKIWIDPGVRVSHHKTVPLDWRGA